MIEVGLVTGCQQYQEAWKGLLPQLWEYTKKNPDWVKINSPEELDEELDDG